MGAPLLLSTPACGDHLHAQTRAEYEHGYNNKSNHHLGGVLERHLADHPGMITRSFMRGQLLKPRFSRAKLKLFGSELC